MVTSTDVQMVLLDRRVQKVLYDHALRAGEDKAWLDSLFAYPDPLVLQVPLQGPCTKCPVPPPVVVPERRVPPQRAAEAEKSASLGGGEGAGTAGGAAQ